jgi:hypothetical protein
MWRFLLLFLFASCIGTKPKDFKLYLGVYTSELLEENINILSDTVAIHSYKYNSILHNDTLAIKYFQFDQFPQSTSITLYSVSEKSKLYSTYYGFISHEHDKLLYCRTVEGTSCFMINPKTRAPLFIFNPESR